MLRCTLIMVLLLWAAGATAQDPGPFVTLPGELPPFGRIPPYLPAPEPLPPPLSPPVQQAPAPAPSFAPALPPVPPTVIFVPTLPPPQGPVTNYGTGGMQAPPGAPPNPPYPSGGLMH
jgi:hypothetical protein